MAYTDFENVGGGQGGNLLGKLPIEDVWESFCYRKSLEVKVFINTDVAGILYQDLTGQWKVRLHEDGARDAQGRLTGRVLFEQTITWTARVVFLAFGLGLALVTWQPLGDGGSGSQQTSIVDGQDCPVVENVNDPAQIANLETYGRLGAWRFVDSATIRPDATPRQKYDVERGFSIFTSEGAATLGGYTFNAVWQSPYYRLDIPEGAVLDTVFDNWQSSILTEARYTVSGREGAAGEAFLFDERVGDRLHVYVSRGIGKPSVQCRRTRQMRGNLLDGQVQYGKGITVNTVKIDEGNNGTVEENSRLRGLQLISLEGGARACVGATGGEPSFLRIFVTLNRGQDWNRIMNQPLPFVPSANCTYANQTKVVFYGVGTSKKPAFAILELGAQGFALTKTGEATTTDGSTLPVKGSINLESCEGGALRLFTRDAASGSFLAWISSDEGATWAQEQTT